MASINGPIPQSEQPEPKGLSLFSSAAVERWWVQIPARLNRYSSLLSDVWSDGIYLTAWPRVAILLPLISLVFGFVEGASHWSFLTVGENSVSSSIPVVAFAQVLPLVVIGAVVGSLSSNAGLMLVLGYALGDFLFAGPQVPFNRGPWLPSFFYTRTPMLLSYVLFLMLAVLPIVSTKRLLTDPYRLMPGRDNASTFVRLAATAGVQGLFIYIWICVAPMVMRTLWQWPVHSYYGAPVAIGYFRELLSPWLEIAVMCAIVARSWLTTRAERNPEVATLGQKLESTLETAEDVRLFPERLRWLRALLSALLMMLLVSGFIDSIWLGAVMTAVFAAPLLAREYLLPTSSIWMKWTRLVLKVPAVLRLAAAGSGSYLMTLTLLTIFPGQAPARNGAAGAFGVELTSLGFGLLALVALLPPEPTAKADDKEVQNYEISPIQRNKLTRAAARIIVLVAMVMLFTVRKAYASCRDPFCCCAGDSNLCALATAGFPPFWAPVVGALPKRRKKRRDPCAPIRQHLETLELRLQDLLFQKQIYEEETQNAIQGLYDRINHIEQELNALSADISRCENKLLTDELQLQGDEQEAVECTGSTEGEEPETGMGGHCAANFVDMTRVELEISALKKQIADDQTKEASLESENEQDNQQIDRLQYELSNKLEDFDRQAADLRRQIDQARKRLVKCEEAYHQAPAVPA